MLCNAFNVEILFSEMIKHIQSLIHKTSYVVNMCEHRICLSKKDAKHFTVLIIGGGGLLFLRHGLKTNKIFIF